MSKTSPYHETLPTFPSFKVSSNEIDSLVPACKVSGWRGFQDAMDHEFFDRPGTTLVFRGHRRHEWPLTPTLGRYNLPSGVIYADQAAQQLEEFRYALRGRGANFSIDDDPNELWAYGQHHGLATPLLDWTESPFVALFFAFSDRDQEHEQANTSRPIFILNKTALSELDETLFIEPTRNDHTRLINQAGLFTISPIGQTTLITRIMDLLSSSALDLRQTMTSTQETGELQDADKLARFICKIHVPNGKETRDQCLKALRMMNIHHGTLFPDAIGASEYCNTWYGSQYQVPPPANDPKRTTVALDFSGQKQSNKPVEKGNFIEFLQTFSAGSAILRPNAEAVARSIGQIVDEFSGPDWQQRDNVKADLRVRIRKLLRSSGMSAATAGDASHEIVKYLASIAEQFKDKVR